MDSDQALLDAIAHGDDDAVAELYARHRDWALNVALGITRDHDLALDAAQNAWIQAVRRIRKGVRLTAAFTTFLYPYVKHAALKAKRLRPFLRFEDHKQAPPEPERRDDVLGALDSLHPDRGEVLRLRYWHGLTDAEIAVALGKPLGTIKGRLRAALEDMRSVLGDEQGFSDNS